MTTGVLALVLVVSAASCNTDDDVGAEQARLQVSGSATVTLADGESRTVTGGETLTFGDTVTVDEGTATVELASGASYELRSGIEGRGDSPASAASVIEIGAPPVLRDGDVLMTDGFPASVRYDVAQVTARGPTRVQSAVPSATSYAGETQLSGTGDLTAVAGLRTVVLTRSAQPEAVQFNPSDPWDRRFLGEAQAFGERLEALARGYTGDLQASVQPSADFYRSVLPDLAREREFASDLLDDGRTPGDYLIGAAIAVGGRDGTFRERWAEVFAFRDLGASWGIVALDQGVNTAPLLDQIELAVGSSPLSDDPRVTTTTSPPPVAPSPTTVPTSGVDPSSTTTVPTTTTTQPPAEEPDDGGILEPILDPVGGVLDDLLELLGLG